jgi:hypothetical protein
LDKQVTIMPYNNLEASLSQAEQADLIQRIEDMRSLLPFLINLTPKEKNRGKYGQHNYAFLHAAFDYAQQRPELLPPSFSLTGWQADIELYDRLMPIAQQVAMLQEALNDTMFALRTEAQKSALDFLKFAQVAATSNQPGTTGMVENLKSKLSKPYKPRTPKVSPSIDNAEEQ